MQTKYLDTVWYVESFVEFAQQVQTAYKDQFFIGWANGLTNEEYEYKKKIWEAIQLKALANYWRHASNYDYSKRPCTCGSGQPWHSCEVGAYCG
jgi:hypothetical protein